MTETLAFHHVRTVSFAFEPRPWAWAEAQADRIDRHWAEISAGNPSVFDGKVLVLHRGAFEGDAFHGAFLQTRYSRFLSWRDFGFPDRTMRNCFAMGALRAADGAFLLGVMGSHTSNPGKVYFPAGTPDMDDVVGEKVDIGGSVARELGEETGLDTASLTFADDWTIVEHGPRLALMRRVSIDLPADEARNLIHANIAAQDDPELSGMAIVRGMDDVRSLAADMPPFVAAYLRREFELQPAG